MLNINKYIFYYNEWQSFVYLLNNTLQINQPENNMPYISLQFQWNEYISCLKFSKSLYFMWLKFSEEKHIINSNTEL